jgi:HD-GYP domain-containing protein (c-di-GMP phosphodiesterase class II)
MESHSLLDLNRRILRRLFVSWLLVSAVIGSAVYYIGIEQIDDRLVALATTESGKLSDAPISLLDHPAPGALHGLLNQFAREHFMVIELYDRQRNKVAEDINPSFAEIEGHLKDYAHEFPLDDLPHYQKFVIHDTTVLQVLVPVRDRQGALTGYFEGVFAIDEATLASLRAEVLVSLATTLFAVLVTTLVLYPVVLRLNRNVVRQARNLLLGNIELMEVLGSAIAKRDSDTNTHNYRVSIYAVRLAEACNLDVKAIRSLIAGAFLHDVGKIGISDNILLKPGRLDEAEMAIMRTHVTLGVDIIRRSAWLGHARDVVEFHHERFDGAGYMAGLAGEAIPVNARIFAIVDVFDALTSRRPYKEPFPFADAMAMIRAESGRHFDPALLARFDQIIAPLHKAVSTADEAAIETMLHQLIERYFFSARTPSAGG